MEGGSAWALEVATSIGARLSRDALWDERRCNWTGSSMEFIGHGWTVAERTFGADLYAGTSGIAWFLARLHAATGERLFRITAEGALRQAVSRLDRIPPAQAASVYSGALGVAYALVEAGHALDAPALVEEGMAVAARVAQAPAEDAPLDVVGGSAGAIGAFLSLHARGGPGDFLDAAVRHGDHLLAKAAPGAHGCSWDTLPGIAQEHLTGFAHGAAGIAWALLELSAATGEARFAKGAEDGFAYEEAWYSPEHENWPDLRSHAGAAETQGAQPLVYNLAWCHGAPGIGFSRLRAFALSGAPARRAEAEAAVRTTARSLPQMPQQPLGNYSLCHGYFGNADLLLEADQLLGGGSFRALAEQTGRAAADLYEQQRMPWPCGVLGGGETPGLMLGLAGIGTHYLRLYDAARFASPLLIAPALDRKLA
jgi:lantibiotic biosynthesis protein